MWRGSRIKEDEEGFDMSPSFTHGKIIRKKFQWSFVRLRTMQVRKGRSAFSLYGIIRII